MMIVSHCGSTKEQVMTGEFFNKCQPKAGYRTRKDADIYTI